MTANMILNQVRQSVLLILNGKTLNDEEFAKVTPEGQLQILDELKKY